MIVTNVSPAPVEFSILSFCHNVTSITDNASELLKPDAPMAPSGG